MATGELAQDVVDKQETETGNSADKSTMRNLTDPIEDWVSQNTVYRSLAQYSSTDTTTNYNQDTWTTINWDSVIEADSVYSLAGGGVTVDNQGTYRVYAMITYDSVGVARANPGLRILNNGTDTGRRGLSGYTRYASGHEEASNYIEEYITLNSGETITIQSTRYGETGTCTLRSNESILVIEQISKAMATTGDADTVDGHHAGNSNNNVALNNGTLNTNLNADQLDGNHASAFANSGHTHPGGDVTSQVNDADTVDGEHASAFADASHTHAGGDITSQVGDADTVDGEHADAFADATHTHGGGDITSQVGDADTVDGNHAGNSSGNVALNNGILNTNLNADQLDGNEASAFADSSHTHLGGDITSQVGDADTVDGEHASAFAASEHTHPGGDITSQVGDADTVDGEHASAFADASHTHGGGDITSQVSDADTVDGSHASAFAASGHTHPGGDITSQVGDADSVDGAHLSTNTALGTSDTLVPSQNAVKTYVDGSSGGGGAVGNYEIVYNNTDDSLDFNYIG